MDSLKRSERPRVMIVDDNAITQRTLSLALESEFDISTASSGEECLERFPVVQPDLVLLDIEMDGINGHETCRRLRENSQVPVLFVSSHDSLEDRVAAFDSGGDDFIVKPCVPDILLRKVRRAVAQRVEQARIEQEKASLESMAHSFLMEVGRTGQLLNFVRSCVAIEDYGVLADRVIESARDYNVNCVVQIHHEGGTVTRNPGGEATALEASIINRSMSMGRFFQFSRRLVVNFDSISVLVLDLPTDEEEAGKVRDNISILAESADGIAKMINLRHESSQRAETLQVATMNSQNVVEEIRELYRQQQASTRVRLQELIDRVEKTYYFLGLTQNQEEVLSQNLRDGADNILALFEEGLDLDRHFSHLLDSMVPSQQNDDDIWL